MKRALVCAPLPPEFDRDSGSRRTFDLISLLRRDGWAVSFFAQGGSPSQERYRRALRQLGVAVYSGSYATGLGDEFTWDVGRLLAHERFDLAILTFWHAAESFIPAIRRMSPWTRIVIDTIDLAFLRNSRRTLRGRAQEERGRLSSDVGREFVQELNVYSDADALLMVSQKEAELVGEFLGERPPAFVVPLLEAIPLSPTPFELRSGVLFLGNFRHPPNVEAMQHLCRDILPKLPANLLGRDPVYIVGSGLDEELARLGAGQPHVRMVGWVPSVEPYLHRARITVLPLLHGAGTKGKLIQALMAGTPSVSTNIGIEGLGLADDQHVLVADDAHTFATAIERLLRAPELWRRLAQAGRELAVERHGEAAVRVAFLTAVERVMTSRASVATGGA